MPFLGGLEVGKGSEPDSCFIPPKKRHPRPSATKKSSCRYLGCHHRKNHGKPKDEASQREASNVQSTLQKKEASPEAHPCRQTALDEAGPPHTEHLLGSTGCAAARTSGIAHLHMPNSMFRLVAKLVVRLLYHAKLMVDSNTKASNSK